MMSNGMGKVSVNDWVERVFRSGQVCGDYMRKWQAAQTKAERFRVIADTNSGEWLIALDAKGVALPVDDFCNEYRNFINGAQVVEYPQGYTSTFYCQYFAGIDADTTLVHVFHCDLAIRVPANTFPRIILSRDSMVRINVEKGARLAVEDYGARELEIRGDTSNVKITKHYE